MESPWGGRDSPRKALFCGLDPAPDSVCPQTEQGKVGLWVERDTTSPFAAPFLCLILCLHCEAFHHIPLSGCHKITCKVIENSCTSNLHREIVPASPNFIQWSGQAICQDICEIYETRVLVVQLPRKAVTV